MAEQPLLIAITATFTAEPVADSLGFWLQELNIPAFIEFAPYNQIFQQLLDPASLVSSNHHGINVVLLRLEDWQTYSNSASVHAKIEQTVQDLVLALKAVAARTATPNLVCVCPSSPTVMAEPEAQAFFNRMEALLVSELAGVSGLYLIPSTELIATYPVANYYNPQGDKLGHIPFTPLFFAALGTVLARKMYAIQSPPYKVVVLDCDQTLWKGVCGEDGVMGITIDPPRKALQDFMVAQYEAGVLICLCSKNNEAEVVEVFERRLDMPLKRNHIVSWRINWNTKSENLKSLANELNLGLDSFIFIDDNPVECAEVNFNCPEVLTLLLPQNPEEIPRFLQHIWAFDRLKKTAEDKQRTSLYRHNLERDRLRQQALNLEDFLVGLGLKIEISPMAPMHLARVAQLTQRTNQFNLTTIRRTEQEIHQLEKQGLECLVVEVGDRFGDYGLVGVILFATDTDALHVDTFLLSCRVLGRGVEHHMLAQLAEIAKVRGLTRIDFPYVPTQKNQPALNFLNSVGIEFKQGYSFQFPVEYARAVVYNPQAAASEMSALPSQVVQTSTSLGSQFYSKSTRLSRIATELYSAQQVFNQLESQLRQRPELQKPFVPPRTETEQQLALIWMKLLRVDQVGIKDNFFELGGNSVLAVQLFTQIEKIFGKNLPLVTLIQATTIEQLASVLIQQEWSTLWSSLVVIQPRGTKPPIFLLHAISGNALYYSTLAAHLEPEQPIYALQAQSLDGKQPPLTRIEDMAAYYIKQIYSVQPEGPYFLGGSSFGGVLAFEMAYQLHAQGHKIALLALFDVISPKYNVFSFRNRAARNLQLGREYILARVKEKINSLKSMNQERMQKIASKFSPTMDRPVPDVSRDIFFEVATANIQALADYVPQVYPFKVTLFRAINQPKGSSWYHDAQLGWGELATGGVEIYQVPGDHLSLMAETDVRVLAEKFKVCLNEAQANLYAML